MSGLTVVGIACTQTGVYVLRGDGQVFVLVSRGAIDPMTGDANRHPYWAKCPAIPGTEAAVAEAG